MRQTAWSYHVAHSCACDVPARSRHRRDRLLAIKRLDLAFLIDAEDKGSIRRGQVKADDIAYLPENRRGKYLESVPSRGPPIRLPLSEDPSSCRGVQTVAARSPRHRAQRRTGGAVNPPLTDWEDHRSRLVRPCSTRSRHRIPDPGDGFLLSRHEMGGAGGTSAGDLLNGKSYSFSHAFGRSSASPWVPYRTMGPFLPAISERFRVPRP